MFKGQGSPTVSPAIAATVLGMAFSSSFYQNAFLILPYYSLETLVNMIMCYQQSFLNIYFLKEEEFRYFIIVVKA